jgi:coenzyme F420-0:L-glutamate ligase / coenzyme F420-1:gamma-L-glutamate ligase
LKPLTIYPITQLPEITTGAPLADLLAAGIRRLRLNLEDADVLVVTQKVVSKAEGRVVDLTTVVPGEQARSLATITQLEPRHVEVILRESVRVVRAAPRVLVTETRQGFVCAHAGVDRSNVGSRNHAVLLPEKPDASAAELRARLKLLTGAAPGVIVSDSFGRPWREGQVNVAIGAAGVACLHDYRGLRDPDGYQLQGSVLGVADELAAAAELVMGKLDRVPAALIRGAEVAGEGNAQALLRDPSTDLFR